MPLFMQLILVSVLCVSLLPAQQRNFPQPPPARDVTIAAIPGVIDAGAKWTLVWQGNENADGIVGTGDGGLLFAQEQSNHVNKLDKNGKLSVFLPAHGPGAVTIGPKNRIIVVERTCTDPGGMPEQCKEPTGIAALTPMRTVLADSFAGKGLGRVNDLVADKKGGVYFTSNGVPNGVFYIKPKGEVIEIGENLRPNGIMLSRDEKTLNITNGPVIMALDVQPDGSVKNQREFGKLVGGNGDGMTIDAEGRIFDTDQTAGIEVFSPDGKHLGIIPTPRTPISVAFSGAGKKTLYVSCLGALGPDGKEIATRASVRNTAMSIYKIQMVAQGFKGRAK
jgi:gluconolactonase